MKVQPAYGFHVYLTTWLCTLALLLFNLLCGAASSTWNENKTPKPMEVTLNNNNGDLTLEHLKRLKEAGATSIQRYIFWKDIETAPGVYDWSAYDAELELVRKAGLKWVPFVIAGPHYVTPDFVRQDKEITFYKCLEHGKENLIPSIWCPRFPHYIEGWLKAFSEHYVKTGLLESVQLGVTGGYGEAIFPADLGAFPITMHAHIGFWCGDQHAIEDFRRYCRIRYHNDIKQLNQEWGVYYPDFDVVRPFTRDYSPSPKAWLVFIEWYRDSMNRHAEWWFQTAQKYYKDVPLYLCTGGNMTLEHGTDFFAQAKLAAKYGAGARVTNENVWLPKNVYLTRMLGSAANFYGSYWGGEPASYESPAGSVGRIFNLHTFGARQLFTYHFESEKKAQAFIRNSEFLTQQKPQHELAYFYPTTSCALEYRYGSSVSRPFAYRVRERIDYAFVDEQMIRDGALDEHTLMLVFAAEHAPHDIIQQIHDWVKGGGILISINARLSDLNGDTRLWDQVTGLTEQSDRLHAGIRGRSLDVLEPDILPSFKEVGWDTRNGMSRLDPSCRILMRMKPYPECIQSWMHSFGEGMVIAYEGSPNTDGSPGLPLRHDQTTREEDYRSSDSPPALFLKDALAYISTAELLGRDLPSLWLGDRSVFLSGLANGDLIAVNVGKEMKSITRNGVKYELPAETIVRIEQGATSETK